MTSLAVVEMLYHWATVYRRLKEIFVYNRALSNIKPDPVQNKNTQLLREKDRQGTKERWLKSFRKTQNLTRDYGNGSEHINPFPTSHAQRKMSLKS